MQKRMCVHIAVIFSLSQLICSSYMQIWSVLKVINLYLNPFLAPTHSQIITFFFRKMISRAPSNVVYLQQQQKMHTAFLYTFFVWKYSLRFTLLALLSSSSITKLSIYIAESWTPSLISSWFRLSSSELLSQFYDRIVYCVCVAVCRSEVADEISAKLAIDRCDKMWRYH